MSEPTFFTRLAWSAQASTAEFFRAFWPAFGTWFGVGLGVGTGLIVALAAGVLVLK